MTFAEIDVLHYALYSMHVARHVGVVEYEKSCTLIRHNVLMYSMHANQPTVITVKLVSNKHCTLIITISRFSLFSAPLPKYLITTRLHTCELVEFIVLNLCHWFHGYTTVRLLMVRMNYPICPLLTVSRSRFLRSWRSPRTRKTRCFRFITF